MDNDGPYYCLYCNPTKTLKKVEDKPEKSEGAWYIISTWECESCGFQRFESAFDWPETSEDNLDERAELLEQIVALTAERDTLKEHNKLLVVERETYHSNGMDTIKTVLRNLGYEEEF